MPKMNKHEKEIASVILWFDAYDQKEGDREETAEWREGMWNYDLISSIIAEHAPDWKTAAVKVFQKLRDLTWEDSDWEEVVGAIKKAEKKLTSRDGKQRWEQYKRDKVEASAKPLFELTPQKAKAILKKHGIEVKGSKIKRADAIKAAQILNVDYLQKTESPIVEADTDEVDFHLGDWNLQDRFYKAPRSAVKELHDNIKSGMDISDAWSEFTKHAKPIDLNVDYFLDWSEPEASIGDWEELDD